MYQEDELLFLYQVLKALTIVTSLADALELQLRILRNINYFLHKYFQYLKMIITMACCATIQLVFFKHVSEFDFNYRSNDTFLKLVYVIWERCLWIPDFFKGIDNFDFNHKIRFMTHHNANFLICFKSKYTRRTDQKIVHKAGITIYMYHAEVYQENNNEHY